MGNREKRHHVQVVPIGKKDHQGLFQRTDESNEISTVAEMKDNSQFLKTPVLAGSSQIHRGSRRSHWQIAVATALLAMFGCGGPKTVAPPSVGEAKAEFLSLFAERKSTMARQPAFAGQELELIIEALASKAEAYGDPFTDWLEEVRRVREQWGARPKKADVSEGVKQLEQAFAVSPDKP